MIDSIEATLRSAVVDTARAMNACGINRGKSGNVSARLPEGRGFLITPTGVAYDALGPADIVRVAMDGSIADDAAWLPSSEWRLHREILDTRADADAVVHAHPIFATTLACLQRAIPAFHYMVVKAGGCDIRCSAYATFGSQALAEAAVQALAGRSACLLAQHGMVAIGKTLEAALSLAVDVESLAEIYWRVVQIGEPTLLDTAEIAVVAEQFRDYGTPQRRR